MERRQYAAALRDDDRKHQRKWALAVVAFYVVVLGVLGSAMWLGAKPPGADFGEIAMAGRVVPPNVAALSLLSP